ncbi:hypothetical protein HBI56_011940 [Parastagonospora nodorum]|nr:hypothetical protein HBH53_171010 [Parastagonospora nodorum]KAH3986972.1 hypothetical protein HBH51_013650 [Parastagonospora nodorum]KAH4033579.1 hypothetical protein HBI13_012340 [Parastagonospora nodorum]KAH4042389.1 hypothetical protein HBI09_012320 [Parastagonospora nodorum]KAH4099846.1 hypothetical protein HBH48_012530 [Parastagonospora nodorum]
MVPYFEGVTKQKGSEVNTLRFLMDKMASWCREAMERSMLKLAKTFEKAAHEAAKSMPVRSTHVPEVLANTTPSFSMLSVIQKLDTAGCTYTSSEFNHAFLKIGIVKSDHHAMQETAKELKNRPGLTEANPAAGQQASVKKAADAVAKGG